MSFSLVQTFPFIFPSRIYQRSYIIQCRAIAYLLSNDFLTSCISIDNNNHQYGMKIINEFYLLTFGIILIGIPISLYIKLNEPNTYTYNIAIYGDTIDTSMLAYYIDKYIHQELRSYEKIINFNITLISSPEGNNKLKESNTELSKKVYSFCGVEREWMNLVENTNLKYSIKEYGVYFGQTIEGIDKNQFKIYSTESSVLDSMMQYGLSNFAVYNFFEKFAKSINSTSKSSKNVQKFRMQDLTISSIIKNYFPNSIQEDSIKYFSVDLGLDQKYISQFIYPVIFGNYLHEANSLSTLYKLLPVYCHKNLAIGKSLAIFEQPQRIKQKILGHIKTAKLNLLSNKEFETYSMIKNKQNQKKKYVNVVLNYKKPQENQTDFQAQKSYNDTTKEYIKSDVLFIFDDYESVSSTKPFTYYKTIIDGKIKNDQKYEQFFTIYLKQTPKKKQEAPKQEGKKQKSQAKAPAKSGANQIYSITRVCAYNCKGYENSVYVLVSKHRFLNSKQLSMFQSHDIKSFKKFAIEKSQMPTSKKLQQNENVYKLYDIQSISDSYELQMNLVKQIARSLIDKIRTQYNL